MTFSKYLKKLLEKIPPSPAPIRDFPAGWPWPFSRNSLVFLFDYPGIHQHTSFFSLVQIKDLCQRSGPGWVLITPAKPVSEFPSWNQVRWILCHPLKCQPRDAVKKSHELSLGPLWLVTFSLLDIFAYFFFFLMLIHPLSLKSSKVLRFCLHTFCVALRLSFPLLCALLSHWESCFVRNSNDVTDFK